MVFLVGFFQGWQNCPKAAESCSAVGVLGSWERGQHRLRGVLRGGGVGGVKCV